MEEYVFDRPDWYDDAECRGYPTNLWYPGDKQSISPKAKKICARCPVQNECLEHGIENEFYGVWGGMSLRQRSKIRGSRGIKTSQKNRNRRD